MKNKGEFVMVFCDKNDKCTAKYAEQQKHCKEALSDWPLGPGCQYWHYPDKCGICHLIDNDKKKELKQ